ncbi:MAG: DUF3313 family protein [Methylicorpusculum sp.]|uniref:DUF3313 family protein n=1 Tax=Methylicorpusculum sp. TaxID=2713644 RepID=UPI002721032B|nr:DUF3313 family protein [Methylicorpusculum sp.]MDO8843664.1 DUF3313 family protein [Methylicorpusculum sp.]MDO8939106.1 DUF3313 family protein [Methylicorpusculum sp.]MDO9238968.1 DUF3313 family protein [Methylicorpusculum sp.]MDP2179962.1 DUF3313 family protein [Methylicorpusculum sp.]MDP2200695.1 DUF3313 family protein [Methylicorpusculum sp.]
MNIDRQTLKRHSVGVAVLFGAMAVATGCTTGVKETNAVKSELVTPAPDVGFIDNPERQTRRADLPFQKVWIKPGFDASAYKELVVAPVNTQYILEMDWLHKASSASWLSDVKKDIAELAQYFHDQVVKEFKEDPNQRFRVIEFAGQHKEPALRLELALIQIDPSQPVLHALGWLQMGGGTAAGAINQRRAAFEGRLRDMQTGEVVATFADRDMQDAGPLDLTRLTWYGPAKGIMDRWAEQFVKIANRKPGEMVTDPVPYTLKPF